MFCEAQSRRRLHQTPALRNCNYKLTLKTLGRPVLKLHAERKTVGSEDFLDLVQGLAAQIRGLQEFVLGALDQIADVGDALGLQAVRGANREFEVIGRIRTGSSGGGLLTELSSSGSALSAAAVLMEPKIDS